MSEQEELSLSEFWYRYCPEWRHFKTRAELREAKRAFQNRNAKRRRLLVPIIVIAALSGGLSHVAVRWLISHGLSWWLASLINMLCWAIITAAVVVFFWRRPYIRFVRQYLQERGVAICLKCGYDLRGQVKPRCPECGQDFDEELLKRGDDRDPLP